MRLILVLFFLQTVSVMAADFPDQNIIQTKRQLKKAINSNQGPRISSSSKDKGSRLRNSLFYYHLYR